MRFDFLFTLLFFSKEKRTKPRNEKSCGWKTNFRDGFVTSLVASINQFDRS